MTFGHSMYRQDIGHGLEDHSLAVNEESIQVLTHGREEDTVLQCG